MSKQKIKLVTVGRLPLQIDFRKIQDWNSSIFEIPEKIETFPLNSNADGVNWEFSDERIDSSIPTNFSENFLIAIVNVPIQNNFYLRRLNKNRVVFTFYEIKDYLKAENIPLENAILRVLYSCCLIYKRSNNEIPETAKAVFYTHDETRGCLFDMNGIKAELTYSCHQPSICTECQERLKKEMISETMIKDCIEEIKKIRKPIIFILTDFVTQYPLLSIFISSMFALVISAIGSLIASVIYKYIFSA
jgi:hypothetical protein